MIRNKYTQAPMLITSYPKCLLTGLVVLFLGICQNTYAMHNDQQNLYAGMDYPVIFDQSTLLSKPEFSGTLKKEGLSHLARHISTEQAATSDQLNDLLVQDFRAKKASAMYRALREPVAIVLLDAGLFLLGRRYLPKDSVAAGFNTMFGMQTIGENAKKFSRAIYNMWDPEADPLHHYEELYAQKKRFLSDSLQEKIEAKFAAARKSAQSMESVLEFCQTALGMPTKSGIQATFSAARIDEHYQHALNTFQNCGKNIQEAIAISIVSHIIRSKSTTGTPKTPKIVILAQGPPGVGKTYITKKIAEELEVPYKRIDITSSDASELMGNDNSPGKLLEAITHRNRGTTELANDCVIHIDDIDRIVNNNNETALATFLTLLEPTTTSYRSPWLKADVDISRYFFVLCCNQALKCDALNDRVKSIIFGPMSKERKTEIVTKSILPELCKSEQPEFAIDPQNLKPDEQERIRKLIDEDNEPGIRKLQLNLSELVTQFRLERAQVAWRSKYTPLPSLLIIGVAPRESLESSPLRSNLLLERASELPLPAPQVISSARNESPYIYFNTPRNIGILRDEDLDIAIIRRVAFMAMAPLIPIAAVPVYLFDRFFLNHIFPDLMEYNTKHESYMEITRSAFTQHWSDWLGKRPFIPILASQPQTEEPRSLLAAASKVLEAHAGQP